MPRDVQIAGAIGAAPQSYEVPNATEIIPRAITAVFDGTGAAAAFLPTVEIISDGGVVVSRSPCSTAVVAGGSAEVSFYPFSDEPTSTAGGYTGLVASVGGAGTLRGYWRLGEAASPFLDSSGYSGGPTNMTVHAIGTAYTPQIPGALGGGQDDGALQLNQPISGGYWLDSASTALFNGIPASFTIAAWVWPFASASGWRGGIFSNQSVVGGSPSHEEGWSLEGFWLGGTTTCRLTRAVAGATVSAAFAITPGSWWFMVATYDGATIKLYQNGILVASVADARPQVSAVAGNPTIGSVIYMPGVVQGQFYGKVDEVALWGVVLTQAQIQALYGAAF